MERTSIIKELISIIGGVIFMSVLFPYFLKSLAIGLLAAVEAEEAAMRDHSDIASLIPISAVNEELFWKDRCPCE